MSRCGESGLANWPCQPGNCPRCGHGAEEGAWACEDAGQCLADQLRARLAAAWDEGRESAMDMGWHGENPYEAAAHGEDDPCNT